VFRAQLGGGQQHPPICLDHLTIAVKGFDQSAVLFFLKAGFLDRIETNFVDNLNADCRLTVLNECLGGSRLPEILRNKRIQPAV
jgi:hypothetical protein